MGRRSKDLGPRPWREAVLCVPQITAICPLRPHCRPVLPHCPPIPSIWTPLWMTLRSISCYSSGPSAVTHCSLSSACSLRVDTNLFSASRGWANSRPSSVRELASRIHRAFWGLPLVVAPFLGCCTASHYRDNPRPRKINWLPGRSIDHSHLPTARPLPWGERVRRTSSGVPFVPFPGAGPENADGDAQPLLYTPMS